MALGEIKTFDYNYTGLQLQINVIDNGDGTVKIVVTCVSGAADINALYWNDGVADGNNFDLGTKKDNSLNMNGTGEDWDGGYKVSSTGLGSDGVNKASYLTTGETLVLENISLTGMGVDGFDALDTLGVRATSTSTAGGSIKGVDGEPTETPCPHVSINDVTVAEEDGTAQFTVSIEQAYLYDVTITYTTADGTAGSSDYTATSGSITILAGQTSGTITVPILDDNNPESTENFFVNLTGMTAVLPGNDLDVTDCIVDAQGEGTITDSDRDETPPPADTVTAVDDPDFACGVEGLIKVTGNVLDNDTDSLGHDLDITHVNGVALSTLDGTPDGDSYEFAITNGTLKINAETGDFEFTYTGPNLPVGGEWEGSFTYTVTDGDNTDDSEASVHTATVDLCVDAAAASHGYWTTHSFSNSEGFAANVGNTTFDDFFTVDSPSEHTWQNPTLTDLTFTQALNATGNDPDIVPAVAGNEAELLREAATAVLNYYDNDSQASFVASYIYLRNADDNDANTANNPTDAASVLADLKSQVDASLSGAAGAYSVGDLADLLKATHEA